MPGKTRMKRRPLTELYVNGNFTEDREEWKHQNFNGIVRKCLWIPKKQKEVQEERIKYFKKRGDQQFTKDGRGAEITIDWVLQAHAKMSGNSVNGPESRRCK